MKNLFAWTLLLGSLATGCQNADLSQMPQIGNASSTQNAIETPVSTTRQTPQSSRVSKTQPSALDNTPIATSPNSPTDAQRTCRISAYVIDKDPKGVNVRSGPGKDYNIVGNLPTTTIAVFADLAASQGSWVQLTKAVDPQEKVEFQGTGWVYAQLLGTTTRGYGTQGVSVYSSADTQSSVIGRIPPSTGVTLLGCDQKWALVDYQGTKGWIAPDAQCPNPLTTCP
ncbi:MAG TPA: SH3 domain-containing protein [Waterburya sp.]|jgi:uncharacterized protein YraI